MATALDLGLLDFFVAPFAFILVFVIVWALLEKTGFFGGGVNGKWANALIAFTLAILFIVVPEATTILSIVTPWIVILLIFLIFIVLIFLFMGVSPDVVSGAFRRDTVFWIILILCVGIFGYALMQVYGDEVRNIMAGDADDPDDLTQSIGEILFTPKVMGLFLLLGIAALVVRFVSAQVGGG